jgi:hypothetical protein
VIFELASIRNIARSTLVVSSVVTMPLSSTLAAMLASAPDLPGKSERKPPSLELPTPSAAPPVSVVNAKALPPAMTLAPTPPAA